MLSIFIGLSQGYQPIEWYVWNAKPFEKKGDTLDIVAKGTANTWFAASKAALTAVQAAETVKSRR